MEETKLTAALPNLDIQILHRDDPERGAETIAVQITATPSFDALRGMMGPALLASANPLLNPAFANANPMLAPWLAPWAAPMRMWSDAMRQAWAPWLRLTSPPGGREP
ncbi:hypothetical protein [Azospirillum brasilense]|uniref:Uncharacterized protein n=1 Tax=Azospirillum brasilense TaxID=192 RepID=A0A235HIW3_AZOBR|nr:hypothetical protein [Azospirillum brasilense]OYD85125.1 hypothetical protein CHT98_06865 [Azospirillum brasilense]